LGLARVIAVRFAVLRTWVVFLCLLPFAQSALALHSADQNGDHLISLTELLRVIQFFNSGGYACANPPSSTEDGYLPGPGDTACAPHDSDYAPQNFAINLSELLRLVQFFNSEGYSEGCGTEDGFQPGQCGRACPEAEPETTTVTLSPAADVTLYEDAAGARANGAGPGLFVGETSQPKARRAALRFDIAGALPPCAQIVSVELHLHLTAAGLGATPTEIGVWRIAEAWNEGPSTTGDESVNPGGQGVVSQNGDTTWLHTFFNTQFWSTPGGTLAGNAPRATATVGSEGECVWNSPALAEDVQAMLGAPAGNFGWMLLGEEDEPGNARRFASSEHPTTALRPFLRVEYID
jgi:hypothetical protein